MEWGGWAMVNPVVQAQWEGLQGSYPNSTFSSHYDSCCLPFGSHASLANYHHALTWNRNEPIHTHSFSIVCHLLFDFFDHSCTIINHIHTYYFYFLSHTSTRVYVVLLCYLVSTSKSSPFSLHHHQCRLLMLYI